MDNLLQGGRRRRRARNWVLAIVVVLVPLAVGAAVWEVLQERGKHGGSAPAARPVHHARHAGPKPIPVVRLGRADRFHLRFHAPPRAGLVVDLDNGDVLWRLHPRARLPIASLTKIMTALLVTERARPRERVLITKAALHYQGTGVGVLPLHKRVRLETLMYGMLLVSGNDAALALAVHVSGTVRRFVRLMNRRARRWGLRCTHFVSPDGIERRNVSCPRDLAVLARLAMENRRIRRIVRRRQARFRFPVKGHWLVLAGHNPLIRARYRGTIGLKTGFTDAAGHCFVGVARRHRHTLAAILLNSDDPLKQSAKLLNDGFAHV